MNVKQLIEEVNKDIDDSLDNADIIGWFNRCLDDLTPIVRKEALKITDADTSNTYELPEDLHEIAFIRSAETEYRLIPLNDKTSRGYKVWGEILYMQPPVESGELELFYYKRLDHVEDGEDVPEIDPAYHDLLALYAIAHYQYADEEPQRQQDAMNRYFQRKNDYQTYIMRNSNEVHQVSIVNPVY